jgi:hypothetical protein
VSHEPHTTDIILGVLEVGRGDDNGIGYWTGQLWSNTIPPQQACQHTKRGRKRALHFCSLIVITDPRLTCRIVV